MGFIISCIAQDVWYLKNYSQILWSRRKGRQQQQKREKRKFPWDNTLRNIADGEKCRWSETGCWRLPSRSLALPQQHFTSSIILYCFYTLRDFFPTVSCFCEESVCCALVLCTKIYAVFFSVNIFCFWLPLMFTRQHIIIIDAFPLFNSHFLLLICKYKSIIIRPLFVRDYLFLLISISIRDCLYWKGKKRICAVSITKLKQWRMFHSVFFLDKTVQLEQLVSKFRKVLKYLKIEGIRKLAQPPRRSISTKIQQKTGKGVKFHSF